ncbi:MAG: hypothetical protein ACERKZ_02455 [Lachnotalea sp.]
MKNATYMNRNNTGVVNSTLDTKPTSNEAYMSLSGMSKQDIEVVKPLEEIKPYILRKLNSTDLFPMIKIISKIGLGELTQVLEGNVIQDLVSKVKGEEVNTEEEVNETNGESVEEKNQFIVGIGIALKLANKILENIPSCEREIYTLLSNVSGITVEDVKVLDLDIFLEMIMDFIMKDEFKSFFKVASKYIK